MAQITIYEPFNFLSPFPSSSYSSRIYGYSSTAATYSYTGSGWTRYETFYGQLSYPAYGGVSGVVTAYEFRSTSGPILLASLNVDATTLYSYIAAGATTGALAYGLSGSDTINGSYGQDVVTGFTGDDYIDLKGGTDFVYFYGPSQNYSLTFASNGRAVIRDLVGDEGTDTLVNVEYVKFSDWGEYRSLASMAPASYSISANASTASEGQTATFTLSTANVAAGTLVTYTISGVSAPDVVGGNLSGSVTIGADGRATISIPIAADNLTEGNEDLTVQVQGQRATITILDTSKFAPITYTFTPPIFFTFEGGRVEFVLSGDNVTAGTVVQYSLSGVSSDDINYTSSPDLVTGQLSGSTKFGPDGKANIAFWVADDNLIEGNESLVITAQGKTASVKITDSGRLDTSVRPNVWTGSPDADRFHWFNKNRYTAVNDTIVWCGAGDDYVLLNGVNEGARVTVYGGAGDDRITTVGVLYGEAGNDVFTFGSYPKLYWDDTVADGGDGIDRAEVSKRFAEVSLTLAASGSFTVAAEGSQFTLKNVERISFSDTSLALDATGNAGKAYRVYKAAFARDPMAGDKTGLGYWIKSIDNGMDMVEVAARFIDSPEFRTLYGQNPSNAEFLTKVYTNVLGRTPDQGGYSWWLNELNTNPIKTKAKVLSDFAESQENKDSVVSLIGNGIQYVEHAF